MAKQTNTLQLSPAMRHQLISVARKNGLDADVVLSEAVALYCQAWEDNPELELVESWPGEWVAELQRTINNRQLFKNQAGELYLKKGRSKPEPITAQLAFWDWVECSCPNMLFCAWETLHAGSRAAPPRT